jgi:hypothetical protein
LEHSGNKTVLSKSNDKNKSGSSSKKTQRRSKRHIGVPDHGGYQRIIATAGLAPSLRVVNSDGPADSIDVVFTTYWQYPAKVRIILPEDKACIEHYRKLSKQGGFKGDKRIVKVERLKSENYNEANQVVTMMRMPDEDVDNDEDD